nr:hypothetical protein CFP56_23441 [Quercus suber]
MKDVGKGMTDRCKTTKHRPVGDSDPFSIFRTQEETTFLQYFSFATAQSKAKQNLSQVKCVVVVVVIVGFRLGEICWLLVQDMVF